MRLLVVEDSHQIARMLVTGLKPYYAIDVAATGQDGLEQAESTPYDVILLDLNLPDIGGEDICRRLRKKGITTPILILTGEDDVDSKVALLDTGADDYITKPFSLDELKARIRVSLRKASRSDVSQTVLEIGDLRLDPALRTVLRGDKPIVLRRKEFDLLEYLLRNKGRVLTRTMIIDHIWDRDEDLWANVIDVHIKHLRDKIDRPYDSHLIQTVHGVGYKLEIKREGVANT